MFGTDEFYKKDYEKHTNAIVTILDLKHMLREARSLIQEAAENGDFSDSWNDRTVKFHRDSSQVLDL